MIRIPQVRVVDEEGNQLGVMATPAALQMAQDRGYDLVEVAPMAAPPVVKFLDFGHYKYELTKREKEAKRNEAAAQAMLPDEVIREWGNVDRRGTVSGNHQPDDQTAPTRVKPLHCGRSRGRVAEAHADPAEYSETDHEPKIALHQAREYTSAREA